jgi:hypothetical protein
MRGSVSICGIALLAACGGGSGGNAAVSKTFNYGAAQPPTASEQAAALSAESAVSDTTAFGSAPDGAKAVAIFGMASDLAASMLGGVFILGRSDPGASSRQALRSTSILADCARKNGNTVTFTNCTETESGITLVVNGRVSASNGGVDWDVTVAISGTQDGVSLNVNFHESGSLKVTATTVTGDALLEIGGSGSSGGRTVDFGVSVAAIMDLTYRSSPSCITSGSLELKRVWTRVPEGASGPGFTDAGVKFTWMGCSDVLVAHSQ